jgi:hypothetical protein
MEDRCTREYVRGANLIMKQIARPSMIAGAVARSLLLPLILFALVLSGCATTAPEPPTTVPTTEPADDAEPTEEPADDAEPTEEPADDAEPTEEPADDAEPTEEPADDTGGDTDAEAPATGEQRNEAGGFSFTVPNDWQVVTNEGIPGLMGIAAIAPEDADIENVENPEELILITAGAEDMVGSAMETDTPIEDLTLEELLDATFSADEDIEISDVESIEIDGNEAIIANLSGEDPALGDTEGSIVLARIGDNWLLQIFGAATTDEWEPDVFENVIDSLSFFEPAPPEEDGEAIPGLPEDVPTPDVDAETAPTPEADADTDAEGASGATDSIFPVPAEAENISDLVTDPSTEQINYETSLDIEEVMAFYREELGSEGATEREILTVITDNTFSMVFDDWPEAEGLAVVVQGTELEPGNLNVNVRLEDI